MSHKQANYQILESTSELRIRVFGNNLKSLFCNAVKAMFECIEPQYIVSDSEIFHEISVTAADRELLLIDFLSEILFYSDTFNEAFYDVTFHEISNNNISAVIVGKKVTGFSIEIKAVTYHEVAIIEKDGKLITDILFDI